MPSAQERSRHRRSRVAGPLGGPVWRIRARLVLLALLLSLASGCGRSPDEQALRETLAEMVAAVEARQPDAFMQHVAEDFAAAKELDRKALHRMLVAQFLRNQTVGVSTGPASVVIDETRAEVTFTAFVTGSTGGWIPERAEGYQIKTLWRFEDGGWLLEWADWE